MIAYAASAVITTVAIVVLLVAGVKASRYLEERISEHYQKKDD